MNILKNLSVLLLTVLVIVGYGCRESSYFSESNRLVGSGELISESRSVPECTGIKMLCSGNIYFTQDVNQSISIQTDNNVLDKVITFREDNNLVIKLRQGSYTKITLNVYVSMKSIKDLIINGDANFYTSQPLDLENFTCTVNGNANINFSGKCSFFTSVVNGSAKINAPNFIVKKCKAAVNGVGALDIYVTDELDASVNGDGLISYGGNPGTVKTTINGQGRIQKKLFR